MMKIDEWWCGVLLRRRTCWEWRGVRTVDKCLQDLVTDSSTSGTQRLGGYSTSCRVMPAQLMRSTSIHLNQSVSTLLTNFLHIANFIFLCWLFKTKCIFVLIVCCFLRLAGQAWVLSWNSWNLSRNVLKFKVRPEILTRPEICESTRKFVANMAQGIRKIFKIVAVRCHLLTLKCTKFDFSSYVTIHLLSSTVLGRPLASVLLW